MFAFKEGVSRELCKDAVGLDHHTGVHAGHFRPRAACSVQRAGGGGATARRARPRAWRCMWATWAPCCACAGRLRAQAWAWLHSFESRNGAVRWQSFFLVLMSVPLPRSGGGHAVRSLFFKRSRHASRERNAPKCPKTRKSANVCARPRLRVRGWDGQDLAGVTKGLMLSVGFGRPGVPDEMRFFAVGSQPSRRQASNRAAASQ